jgi:hypothetical protein
MREGRAMTVRCSGDGRLMEQVGEKQDFEVALTRHGLSHEDFLLRVRRPSVAGDNDEWNRDYVVTVVAVATDRRHSYRGGPRHNWVLQFANDLASGAYGYPIATQLDADDAQRAHRASSSRLQRCAN